MLSLTHLLLTSRIAVHLAHPSSTVMPTLVPTSHLPWIKALFHLLSAVICIICVFFQVGRWSRLGDHGGKTSAHHPTEHFHPCLDPLWHIPQYFLQASFSLSCSKSSSRAVSSDTSPLHVRKGFGFALQLRQFQSLGPLTSRAHFLTTENHLGKLQLHFLFLTISEKIVRSAFSGGVSPE